MSQDVGLHKFHCNLYMKDQHVQVKGDNNIVFLCQIKGEMLLSPLPSFVKGDNFFLNLITIMLS